MIFVLSKRGNSPLTSPIWVPSGRPAHCNCLGSAFAIPLNHCQGAAGKIAESAGEITVRAIDQVFVSETPILSEHHFTQTEIANRINRKMPVEDVQLDRISQSLRHLSAGRIDPHAVRDYGSRLLNSSSHQKRRPIDRMKTQDI